MNERPTYELLKPGDRESVALLYDRYGRKLYSYAVAHWQVTEDEAWELIYQTLYKALSSFKSYTFANEKSFGSFLFKIMINYLRNHYRDTKRRKEQLDIQPFSEQVMEGGGDENERGIENEVRKRMAATSMNGKEKQVPDSIPMKLLKTELAQLEDWQRVLLLLRSQDMPYTEIAKHIDKPAAQLKVYYQRLKARLFKRMSPAMPEKRSTG